MTERRVVILSAVRTPIGSFCGSLSSLRAHELGGAAISAAVARSGIDPGQVDEVIMGQALTAGQGQNPARQAAICAGLPHSVPAFLVNMLCGSGLKSVGLGMQSIQSGSSVVVCGGQESMSQAQHAMHLRTPTKMGAASLADTMITDGLTDAFLNVHMGVTAENVARKHSVSREQQDAMALQSQLRTEGAQKAGLFSDELVSVSVPVPRSEPRIVTQDEYPRHGATLESLAKLRPAFDKAGSVTAGNASGLNDGAAALVLAEEGLATSRGLKTLARLVAFAQVGIDPALMGMGPVPAVRAALSRAGWKIDEVDFFELNEAFAAQSVAVVKELGLDPDKVNVNGGAIALGHPIGASGARVLVTLVHVLRQKGGKKGVAALCVGGGMGVAMCIEAL